MDDPTEEALHDLPADMNLRHRFVTLKRRDLEEPVDQHCIQVYLNDDMSYQLEYREGREERHFQVHVPRPAEMIGPGPIAKVMIDWAHDRRDGVRRCRGFRSTDRAPSKPLV